MKRFLSVLAFLSVVIYFNLPAQQQPLRHPKKRVPLSIVTKTDKLEALALNMDSSMSKYHKLSKKIRKEYFEQDYELYLSGQEPKIIYKREYGGGECIHNWTVYYQNYKPFLVDYIANCTFNDSLKTMKVKYYLDNDRLILYNNESDSDLGSDLLGYFLPADEDFEEEQKLVTELLNEPDILSISSIAVSL